MGMGPALVVLQIVLFILVSTTALANAFWRCYRTAMHIVLILYITSGILTLNVTTQYIFSLIYINLLLGIAYITLVIFARLKYLGSR